MAYDAWFDRPWGRYASTLERQAIQGAVGDEPGVVVLDVGCGSGRISPIGGVVIGVDRDLAMLRLARAHLGDRLICADAEHLPFRDRVADIAVAVTLCEFTETEGLAVAELARVTRDGGRVVVGALNRSSPWGVAHHKDFDQPPWNRARFLTEGNLFKAGSMHGPTVTRTLLFAPDAWPGLRWWGTLVEGIGRRVARHHGAFAVACTTVNHRGRSG